jgi:hypothetical protein
MWTETTQQQYRRDGLRYASDVSDEEWALIETLLPLAKKLGRPRTTEMRDVVNAMLYLLTTGCPVAAAAKGISAVFDGAAVFLPLAGRRVVADNQPFAGDAGARGGPS